VLLADYLAQSLGAQAFSQRLVGGGGGMGHDNATFIVIRSMAWKQKSHLAVAFCYASQRLTYICWRSGRRLKVNPPFSVVILVAHSNQRVTADHQFATVRSVHSKTRTVDMCLDMCLGC
jgi:hypothetical protein